jgi:Sec-independent protein translocase protein TatA
MCLLLLIVLFIFGPKQKRKSFEQITKEGKELKKSQKKNE